MKFLLGFLLRNLPENDGLPINFWQKNRRRKCYGVKQNVGWWGISGWTKYSDVGYELLGMVISAVATNLARKTSSGDVITCGAVMREMVIDRLGMLSTFTPDQMGFDEDGRVVIIERPEQIIARGYDCQYTGTNLIESKVFRRCISASAIYSNPSDICEFAKRTFGGKTYTEGGLFDRPETIALQNKYAVICRYEDIRDETGTVVGKKPKVTPGLGIDCYGIGYSFFDDKGRKTLIYHGARTAGYSGWLGYQSKNTACCLVSCQNLTTYFARARLEQELGREINVDNEPTEIHARFAEINAELFTRHSKEELLGALQRAAFHPDQSVKSKADNHRDLLRELEALEKSKATPRTSAVTVIGAGTVVVETAAARSGSL